MSTTNNLILTLLFITFLILYSSYKHTTRSYSYDYSIDVISQDSVVVRSWEGREYRAHIDSIQAVIEIDNI